MVGILLSTELTANASQARALPRSARPRATCSRVTCAPGRGQVLLPGCRSECRLRGAMMSRGIRLRVKAQADNSAANGEFSASRALELLKSSPGNSGAVGLGGGVPVCFSIHYESRVGQEIFITGSAPQLGAWKGDAAAALTWTQGGVWTATINFAPGTILFYKYFMREGGYLTQWQGGNNIMLVVPRDASAGVVAASDSWDGKPSPASLLSETRIMERLREAEERRVAAEAAAQAAGLVAQSVMKELIVAREEAAQALRFLQKRGMEKEIEQFAATMGPAAMRKLSEHMTANPDPAEVASAFERAARRPGRAAARGPPSPFIPSDEEIDREIDMLLQRAASGASDEILRGGGLGGDDAFDVDAAEKAPQQLEGGKASWVPRWPGA